MEALDAFNSGSVAGSLRFTERAETAFCAFVCDGLGLVDVRSVGSVLAQARLQQHRILKEQLRGVPYGTVLRHSFLSELARNVRDLSPAFQNKSVTYLLDDFSLPKVPARIQKILLPMIWNSGGGYSFRVSAHSESVANEDVRGNRYQINREYREINLGDAYLSSIEKKTNRSMLEASVSDIFVKRFSHSRKFEGLSLRDILGKNYDGQIAKEIKERSESKALRGLRYHGTNTLISLCSGDISYLIDMLGKMLRQQEKMPIDLDRQHKVIKQYAWKELYSLQDCPTPDYNLYDVALNFGKLSLFKLTGKPVGSGKSARPAEYLRVEVELGQEPERLRRAIADLLQHGVFVDGGFSNSSKGTPARRLIFRKIFTPAFPTTYNSRDTFAMSARRFLDFVGHPERFVKRALGEDGVRPEEQQYLLDSLSEPMT